MKPRPVIAGRFRQETRAGAAVEFALIGLAFFAFIFAILNLGLLGFALGTLSRSVQATARWATVQASASYANSNGTSFTLPCLSSDATQFNRFAVGGLPSLTVPPGGIDHGSTAGSPSLTANWTKTGVSSTANGNIPGGIYLTLTASYAWKPLGFAAFTQGIPLKITTAATAVGSALSGASVSSTCN